MFRLKEGGLPKDPQYPVDLKQLGYFITDTGHIKKIDKPDEFYPFYVFNDERHNEVFREAMHECIRREVIRQMELEGVPLLYVPRLLGTKPAASAHATAKPNIPILASPADVLRNCQRLIVIVNDSKQDLGIWAYRVLSKEGGIDGGSAVGFMKELNSRLVNAYWPVGSDMDADGCINTHKTPFNDENATIRAKLADSLKTTPYSGAPGLVLLNPGQLLFSHRYNRAMTRPSWYALPQKSAVHPSFVADIDKNTVPGNRTVEEHVDFVFEHVITNLEFVKENVHVYIIGMLDGGDAVLKLLNTQWDKYKHYISAIALMEPGQSVADITNPDFAAFLARRARAWTRSEVHSGATLSVPKPRPVAVERPCNPPHRDSISRRRASATGNAEAAESTGELSPRDTEDEAGDAISDSNDEAPDNATDNETPAEEVFCPTFSSGVPDYAERIFPTVYKNVLDFFDDVAKNAKEYRNPRFTAYKEEAQPGKILEDIALAATPAPALRTPTPPTPASQAPTPPPVTPPSATPRSTTLPFRPSPAPEKVTIAGVQVDRSLVERAGLGSLAAERSSTSNSPIREPFRRLASDMAMQQVASAAEDIGPSPTTRASPTPFTAAQPPPPRTPTRQTAGASPPTAAGPPSKAAPDAVPSATEAPVERPRPRARASELGPVRIPDAPPPSPPPFPGGAVTAGLLGQEVGPRVAETEGESKAEQQQEKEQERKDSLLRKPSGAGSC